MAKRTVTTIPARAGRFTSSPADNVEKRKVAGYARVSTDHEEQVTSYEAQVSYYTEYIKGRADWEFAGIYTDEGISATNTQHRDGFRRMITDALSGKIDLIVTKSVSRFARNTVDSLTTIRQLKDKGIEVYFEKENIWTLDAKGELLITIMSSLAQEESRSISENTTWGQRKRFADGKTTVPFKSFLGYDRGPDGELVVNEEQAETVRLIYKLFLDGLTAYSIAHTLTDRGIPTPMGKSEWSPRTITSILTNEKYKGDALLQKKFTVDFLQKKMKKNEGEVPQYYVRGDHEAIIQPEVFDFVQTEMVRRTGEGHRYSGVSAFSSKIKCGSCGCWYGAKVWHSNDKYRRIIYQCNHKYSAGTKCPTPHVTEEEIKQRFVRAVNALLSNKDELISAVQTGIATISDTSALERRQHDLAEEMALTAGLNEQYINEHARVELDQNEYAEQHNQLVSRYDAAKEKYDQVTDEIAKRNARKLQLDLFLDSIIKQGPIAEFDENLWASLVDYVEVYSKENIRVVFRDGTEI